MKKFKKLLAAVLTMAMVAAALPVTAFAETSSEASGLSGSGTKEEPYLINNLDDLIVFRNSVNAGETTYNADNVYVALNADIDMASVDWSVNIGDDCNATFDGIFDGKGYTISNLKSTETAQKNDGYICTGLFGAIYGNAVIKNLTIKNVTINTGDYTGNNVGAVVGFAYAATATGSIENVTVCGDIRIDAPNASGVGAIAGYAYYSELTINDCVVNGNEGSVINAKSQVGSVLGYGSSSKGNLAIENCSVQNVAVNGTGLVGGTVGILSVPDGGTVTGSTVKNVDLTVTGEYWQNSAAVVVGSTAQDEVVVSGTTYADVTVNGEETSVIVGSQYVNKPTAVVPAVEACVNDTYYYHFEDAIAAANAKNDATITLQADVELEEGITVEADDKITLDLNGFTLSQTKEQTAGYQMILNDGVLTIEDSSAAKTGKISYTDSGNGGEYISDTIYNRATLIINGGTIENVSSSTVASNGYPHAVDTYSGIRDTSVTINGGTIYCAEYSAVRMFCVSDKYEADLVINKDATIKGAVDMQNGTKVAAKGTLTINGGTFETTKNVNNIRFANWNGGATEYGLTASIKGGSFNGGFTTAYVPSAANWNKEIISGGYFKTFNPAGFVAGGYMAVGNDTDGWTIEEIEGVNVADETVTVVDPETSVSDEIHPDVKNTIDTAAAAEIQKNDTDALQTAADEVEVADAEVKAALPQNVVEQAAAENATIKVEVQPYLDMEVTGYTEKTTDAGTEKTLTVEIDAMYKVVASVTVTDENGEKDTKKADVGEPQKMEVTKPMYVTVPLPADFVADGVEKIYVTHVKDGDVVAVHEATVSANRKTATFYNEYGFSTFIVNTDPSVAAVDGEVYKTLAAAVADAKDGDTIKLMSNVALESRVNVKKEITLDLNGFEITSTVGDSDISYGTIYVGTAGNLTIIDNSTAKTGAITATNTYAVGNYGTVTVNGGRLTGGTERTALYNFYYNEATYGKSTINGGNVDTVWNCGELQVVTGNVGYIDNSGNTSIEGGTVGDLLVKDGDHAPEITNAGVVTIDGGSVTGSINYELEEGENVSADEPILNVSGGSFSATAAETIMDNNALDSSVKAKLTSADGNTVSFFASESDAREAGGIGDVVTPLTVADNGTVTEGTSTTITAPSRGGGGSTKYKASVDNDEIENGSVKLSSTRVSKGSTVTITVTPDEGYELDELKVLDKDGNEVELTDKGNGKFTFKMPKGGVEIEASFEEIDEDVAADEPVADEKEETTLVLTIGQVIYQLDGEYKVNDVAPIIKADRTFLPIRLIAEALGATVTWSEADQSVTIVKGDTTIVIYIGQAFALVNGEPVELDAPAFIANDRTYLPVRFIAENLGADVTWDAETQTVTIVG